VTEGYSHLSVRLLFLVPHLKRYLRCFRVVKHVALLLNERVSLFIVELFPVLFEGFYFSLTTSKKYQYLCYKSYQTCVLYDLCCDSFA